MNPAALKANLQGPQERRHADPEHRGRSTRRTSSAPATRRTRSTTARSRATTSSRPTSPGMTLEVDRRPRSSTNAQRRALQELLRARPRVLALQPRRSHIRSSGSTQALRRQPERRREPARAQGRLPLRRDRRAVRRTATRCGRRRSRPAATATSRATKRSRSGFLAAAELSRARSCSSAPIRSRRRRTCCTPSRARSTSGVKTFQAEDEIAAVCAAIGAATRARSRSPPPAARASRSRPRRSAWR